MAVKNVRLLCVRKGLVLRPEIIPEMERFDW
jgi:hypothetical protein